jgi:hypothetical protein
MKSCDGFWWMDSGVHSSHLVKNNRADWCCQEPCRDRGELEPNAGVLLITVEDDGKGQLVHESLADFVLLISK